MYFGSCNEEILIIHMLTVFCYHDNKIPIRMIYYSNYMTS